jgi:EAL domain-containing protein (putative c-di-GMP-specific phosphodiesterase class I)
MVHFARQTGSTLLAEGIETPAEARLLRELGVDLGQGYLFGRPERQPRRDQTLAPPIR